MNQDQALKRLVKAGGIIFAALILGKLLMYGTRLIMARFLEPGTYGLIFLGYSIFLILATFSVFGLPSGLTRYISYYKTRKDYSRIRGAVASSFKLSLPFSITISVILFLLSPYISKTFFTSSLTPILQIFSLALPFAAITRISVGAFKGFQLAKYEAYVQKIAKNVSIFLIVVSMMLFGLKIEVVYAFLFSFIIVSVLSFHYLRKLIPKARTKPITGEIFHYSWPLLVASTVFVIIGKIDTIMIGLFLEAEEIGIYQAALPTAQLIGLLPVALLTLFMPITTQFYSENKLSEIRDLYVTASKWIFYMTLPLLLLLLAFPKAIINILFGSAYMGGGVVLGILAFGFFINFFGRLSENILNVFRKTKWNMYNSLAVLIINIILNYILIPAYGILGAGLATASSFLLLTIFRLVESHYYLGSWPFSLNFTKSLAAAAISMVPVYYLSGITGFTPVFFIPLLLLFFFLYGLLVLLFKGLGRDDIIIIKSIERKTGFELKLLKKVIKRFL